MFDVSRDVQTRLKQDGYAVVRDVLDQDLLDDARRYVERLRERHPETDPDSITGFAEHQSAEHPFKIRFGTDERIADLVSGILGSAVQLSSSFAIKQPDTDNKTRWHQDGVYRSQFIEPLEVISVWIAVDEVTPENGCLRMIPGSHKKGYLQHGAPDVVSTHDEGDEQIVDLSEKGHSEDDAVDIELEPGDVSLHRPATLHAAHPNTSDRWRRGFAARYTSTRTKMKNITTGRTEAFLVRGSPGDQQRYRKFPRYDPDDDSQMPFSDWHEYNERADRLNEKLTESSRL